MNYIIDDVTRRVIAPNPTVAPVTGSVFAALAGKSRWSTPFAASCDLLGLTDGLFNGNDATRLGHELEPVLLDRLSRRTTRVVVPGDAMYPGATHEGPHRLWKNQINCGKYAGNVDAVIVDVDGKVSAVVECKTTRRVEDWLKGGVPSVPLAYMMQASFYADLLGVEDIIFVLGVVEDNTTALNIADNRIFTFEAKKLDMTADYAAVEELLTPLRSVGMTPQWGSSKADMDVLNYLRILKYDVEQDMTEAADEFVKINKIAAILKAEYEEKTKDVRQDLDEARAKLESLLPDIEGTQFDKICIKSNMGYVTFGYYDKMSYDMSAMEADGIDIKKYQNIKSVKRLIKAGD